jgi:RNA polymerase sigma-70 factor (ECF subfamily)
MRDSQGAPKDRGRDPADVAMDRYARGADDAFDVLYDSLAPRLHAFLFRRARDAETTEDLVQQTFLQIHFARQHFTPGAPVMPWAFAIARRLLIDSFRRSRHEGSPNALPIDVDEQPAPSSREQIDALVGKRRLARQVAEELLRLPEANRTAFELVRYDGLSMTEAAQALGVTVSAVKTRAFRAYQCLRERLGDAVREELGEVT